MVTDNSAAILADLRKALGEGVQKTGEAMVDYMKGQMTAAKSGAVRAGHTASAPGEAPANEHDKLMATLESTPTGETSALVSGGGPEAPYLAEDLEFGSPGGKIAARPLFVPAADAMKPVLVENLTEAIRSVLA